MKKIIFILLIGALCLPALEDKMHLFSFGKLEGVSTSTEKPNFSFHDWFEGTFQSQYENYKSETYGYRNLLIRIFNHIDYILFKQPHANVIIGKEGYLFEESYLDEITGKSFIGKKRMNNALEKLYTVQKYLEDNNILLITILAPGKDYYYQEYIPDYYSKRISTERNYNTLLETARKYNINLIDFNSWFLQMKDTVSYPLFPKQGIHWNFYGMAMCADSIVKYIEDKKHIDLADVNFTLDHPDTLRETDYDIGNILNLLYRQPYLKMAYPIWNIDNTNKQRPRILDIGDSFYWSIYNTGIFSRVFQNEHYYYYYSSIYTPDKEINEKPQDYNILREIKNYDVVLLIQSSANYNNPGVGFIQHFSREIRQFKERSRATTVKITTDSFLQKFTHSYAQTHNESYEAALKTISDSIALSEIDEISAFKIRMRNDPEWLDRVQDKAYLAGISLEKAMEKEAELMFKEKKWKK